MDDEEFDDFFNDLDGNDTSTTPRTLQEDALRSSTPINAPGDVEKALASPIDWFLRVGEEEAEKKRRQHEETEASYQYAMMQIAVAKERRKAESRSTSSIGVSSAVATEAAKKILKFPPSTGVAWVGLNSPDGSHRGYLSARSPSNTASKELRVYGSSEFSSLLESVRAERSATANTGTIDEIVPDAQPTNLRRMRMRFDNEEDTNFADAEDITSSVFSNTLIESEERAGVSYRFNAGASQAIRRNIKLEALIQR